MIHSDVWIGFDIIILIAFTDIFVSGLSLSLSLRTEPNKSGDNAKPLPHVVAEERGLWNEDTSQTELTREPIQSSRS